MSLKESHKKRVDKIKDFTEKNKVFSVIAVIVSIYLLFSVVHSKLDRTDNNAPEANTAQSEVFDDTEETESEHWRFYWVDLWILLGAGGFCTVMIVKERKKAREKL